MTDYTKLIERLFEKTEFDHNHQTLATLRDAHDAIEALQGENGQLHASLQSARTAFEQVCKHRDALAAELAGLKAQEPIGCGYVVKWERGTTPSTYETGHAQVLGVPVCAAPKALAPLTNPEKKKLWHGTIEAHSRWSAYEWFSYGIESAEKHHGIGGAP